MNQLIALSLTLAIEIPIVLLLAWFWRRRDPTLQLSLPRMAVLSAAASLTSHPFAWGSNVALIGMVSFVVRATIIELAITTYEAILYAKMSDLSPLQASLASLLANATSFGVGLLLWYFGLIGS